MRCVVFLANQSFQQHLYAIKHSLESKSLIFDYIQGKKTNYHNSQLHSKVDCATKLTLHHISPSICQKKSSNVQKYKLSFESTRVLSPAQRKYKRTPYLWRLRLFSSFLFFLSFDFSFNLCFLECCLLELTFFAFFLLSLLESESESESSSEDS